MNMMLMAWSLNIGTCCLGDFDRNYAKKILCVGEHDFLLFILAAGFIKGTMPKLSKRKEFGDFCRFVG